MEKEVIQNTFEYNHLRDTASDTFLCFMGSHEINVLDKVVYHGREYMIFCCSRTWLFNIHKGVSRKMKRKITLLEQHGLIRYEPNIKRIHRAF